MPVSDRTSLITIFGGGGFIGRYVCERLLAADVRVRVASRDPRGAHYLQPLAQVGQFGLVRADITDADSVRRATEGSTAVINLVGILKGHFHSVHVTGARNVAEAARQSGARAMVQVSAIGADPESQSAYGRSKGEGEHAVRTAFPGATILRPSIVVGPEDDFTNRFARLGALPVLPVVKPDARFQPVYVEDLARAVAAAAMRPETFGGTTYSIAGPNVLTMRELVETILKMSRRDPHLIDLPDAVSSALSYLGFLPGAPITRDQWMMLQSDNVAPKGGLEAFGITPTPLAAVAEEWLSRYWRGGRFAMRTPPPDAV